MPELVLLANEQAINANSVAYYANGAVVKDDVAYTSTTFNDVAFTATTFVDESYDILVYFISSGLVTGEYFLTSASSKFLVQSTQERNDIRY